ncbi:MAG: virulence factor family protein [Xanthomonadaceae bacterium]|nr:virulence factor family protein [Xanthomonadaceae bacterium]
MRRFLASMVLALLAWLPPCASGHDAPAFGRLGAVQVQRPDATPEAVVLLLSDDAGWGEAEAAIARALAGHGVLVGGIDSAHWRRALAAGGEPCAYPAADLEGFAHWLQSRERMPRYRQPVVVGVGGGGALAYALLAQSPAGTFAGALSLGFCPTLAPIAPLCEANALRVRRDADGATRPAPVALRDPWAVLVGSAGAACPAAAATAFVAGLSNARAGVLHGAGPAAVAGTAWSAAAVAAVRVLARRADAPVAAPADPGLADLPLVEVPASGDGDLLAILVTGDGGWAGLDQDVAAALAARGVPVVALNSLKYFWTARTPQGTADDLGRIARHYLAAWGRRRLLLVGYSQGADVLPFAINRLDPALRGRIAGAALLGLGERASFAFHVSHWLEDPADGEPTAPEVLRAAAVGLSCVRGAEETDSPCASFAAAGVRDVVLPGGHHFDGDYAAVAHAVMDAARGAIPPGR